jgi:hypothetical protein
MLAGPTPLAYALRATAFGLAGPLRGPACYSHSIVEGGFELMS